MPSERDVLAPLPGHGYVVCAPTMGQENRIQEDSHVQRTSGP